MHIFMAAPCGPLPRKAKFLTQFSKLGLAPVICKTLEKLELTIPTPIQAQAIPHLLEGRDLMGLAQTGTGKTAAFSLPLIHRLIPVGSRPEPRTARALVLAPTRELANQIGTNVRGFLRDTHLRVETVVGGASIRAQAHKLSRGTDILIATPGRLLDLVDRKAVRLDQVQYLVLDEADQMLDLGFIKPLQQIAKLVSPKRQTLLFSATMPKQMNTLAATYLSDPVRVEVSPPGKPADKVRQSVHHVAQAGKVALLSDLLAAEPGSLSLVFARTKHGAEKLKKQLVAAGFEAGSIHGNKSQGQRERAIKAFRNGEIRVLVATDVAARGIDISGVTHVFNFDLPEVAENYVHRIGRTARAGAEGEAVAFCGPHETHLFADIERLIGRPIPVVSGERANASEARQAKKDAGARQGQRGPRRNGARGKPGAHARGQGDGGKPAGRGPMRGKPGKPFRGGKRTRRTATAM